MSSMFSSKTPATYRYSVEIFFRVLGLVYIVAIYSLWSQVHGLMGETGVLPVSVFLENITTHLGTSAWWKVPTVFWIDSGDAALSLVCYAGMTAGVMMLLGLVPMASSFTAWLMYLSLTTGGQAFLSFQWDNLLLEAGLLAILLAPPGWRSRLSSPANPPRLVVFLLHWLLFRLMFAAGYVKLASHDASWWDLTALTYHFWTQPLPMWTAWFYHHAPLWFLKTSTALMFFIELVVPFFIFAGRIPRLIAFVLFAFLQVMIAGTGNYGFFNMLTVVLCLPLLDDRLLMKSTTANAEPVSRRTRIFLAVFRLPVAMVVLLVSTATFALMFKREWTLPQPIGSVVRAVAPFRSVNQYGLFAAMTKSRPEIVIEGSYDGREWVAYEFFWKPGDVYRTPVFVAPHMPRLDWQMWFAALGSYQGNPWFMNLLVRLLQGESDVLALLEKNPFGSEPPKYIRAVLYEYIFSTPEQYDADYRWWNRELKGLYCPVLERAP